MSSYKVVRFTNSFDDETTRTLELGPYNATAFTITELKANVDNFNNDQAEEISDTYISPAGGKFTGITGVEVIEMTETEINLNVNQQEEA